MGVFFYFVYGYELCICSIFVYLLCGGCCGGSYVVSVIIFFEVVDFR